MDARRARLTADPFIHVEPRRFDHPLTGRSLGEGDAGFDALRRVIGGASADTLVDGDRDRLRAGGWLVDDDVDLGRRFRLRIVSIETHSVCNQACYFCPVSMAPRPSSSMPPELFRRLVGELAEFRPTLEGVFLSNYNEPTADAAFIERCRDLMDAGLPVAVNTNGTGLTPGRVDELLTLGRLRLLSINLSTVDRARYAKERGHDHLEQVLRNVDYAGRAAVADMMVIVVLGTGDATHQRDVEAVRRRFSGSRFDVQGHHVMDRAGYLPIGTKPAAPIASLRGCENLGSRPLQHLHVTADGTCVFCCEDYAEHYVIGDVRTSSIREILEGDAVTRLRRWSYGLEAAPADFICRKCVFARSS